MGQQYTGEAYSNGTNMSVLVVGENIHIRIDTLKKERDIESCYGPLSTSLHWLIDFQGYICGW